MGDKSAGPEFKPDPRHHRQTRGVASQLSLFLVYLLLLNSFLQSISQMYSNPVSIRARAV
jgi:hypothetical protein